MVDMAVPPPLLLPPHEQAPPRLFAESSPRRSRSGRFVYVPPPFSTQDYPCHNNNYSNTEPCCSPDAEQRITTTTTRTIVGSSMDLGHNVFGQQQVNARVGGGDCSGFGGKIVREETLHGQKRFGGMERLDYDFNKPKLNIIKGTCNNNNAPYFNGRTAKNALPPETIVLDDYVCDDIEDAAFPSTPSRPQSSLPIRHNNCGERSWHRMLEESDWPQWFDDLMQFKRQQQRAAALIIPDEMLVDRDANTTIFHVAAWKAPPALMLLLLDVMTSCSNRQAGHTAMTAEARTRQYLLCGDSDGNTPLHLACANLEAARRCSAEAPDVVVVAGGGTRRPDDADIAKKPTVVIDFTVIKNLLMLGGEALEMQNDAGDTPLHLLLASDAFQRDNSSNDLATEAAAEEAVTSLLHMSGQLAVRQNSAGLTPLHVAIASHCHERVLLQLLQTTTAAAAAKTVSAATIADREGMIPLHYVAAFGETTWALFSEQLVAVYPDSICCQSVNGDTPLHLFVTNGAKRENASAQRMGEEPQKNCCYMADRQTTKLAELLIGTGHEEISPLLVQNLDGLTPLHCCAAFDSPVHLTRLLTDQSRTGYARIASVLVSKSGSTALHLAVSSLSQATKLAKELRADFQRNVESNIAALATPQACAVFDANGRTPLMMAVQCKKASSAVVKTLLKALPESAIATTSKECLALHLACQNRKIKLSSLKALIRAYPAGVSSLTRHLNTPLHEAAKYHCRNEPPTSHATAIHSPPSRRPVLPVEFLIKKYPAALQQRNAKGERPVDRALANGAKTAFVALLEKGTSGDGQLLPLSAILKVPARETGVLSHPGAVYRTRSHS